MKYTDVVNSGIVIFYDTLTMGIKPCLPTYIIRVKNQKSWLYNICYFNVIPRYIG